jgi:2-oxoglutarate ferredoxin oxidoreductase subunit delta
MDDWLLPTIDLDRCDGCGRCVEYCPTKAVELTAKGRPLIVRPRDCAYCGMCEESCPEGCIALVYEIVTPCPMP